MSDIATVTAFVISVPVCLNNVVPHCLLTSAQIGSGFVPTGYGVAAANTTGGWAPLGVGGRAQWNGNGRLLTDLIPSNAAGRGATAYSKDHIHAEGNETDVWAMSVQGF